MESATYATISKRRRQVLRELHLDPNLISLQHYFVADELSDLVESSVVRWFNLNTEKLSSGAILVGINIMEDGALLRVKQVGIPRFWDVKFNESVVFQRVSDEQETILAAREL